MSKVTPCLWFAEYGEDAAKLYTTVVPRSRIDRIHKIPAAPNGPTTTLIELTLDGQPYQILEAGPYDAFNHAVSFVIRCDDQHEVDRIWERLLEGGGRAEQCGWLRDRYGVAWQIVPKRLIELITDKDATKAKRVGEAMMKMVKIDVSMLELAARG